MGVPLSNLNRIVAAGLVAVMFSLPAGLAAEASRLDELFADLAQAGPGQATGIAREIEMELGKSGSPAMDLLLRRGRDAIEAGDMAAAIGHLTALTDHAPDFAEGWHLRSVALFKSGVYGPALADIERALALEPRHYDVIYGLGTIMEALERTDLALAAFEAALALHPHHEPAGAALERLRRRIGSAEI